MLPEDPDPVAPSEAQLARELLAEADDISWDIRQRQIIDWAFRVRELLERLCVEPPNEGPNRLPKEEVMSEPSVDATRPETWPLIMTFAEVCQILRISMRTAYTLRQQHRFPVPPLTPQISGSAPKFSRDDVLQAVKIRSGQSSLAERRKVLSRVR